MEVNKKLIDWKTCASCGVRLWKWLDKNRVKILGANGQDFEIGFTYIETICNKCGRPTGAQSEISENISELFAETSRFTISSKQTTAEENPYFTLSNYDRRAISKKLTDKQRGILKILTEDAGSMRKSLDTIAKRLLITEKEAQEYISIIDTEIEKIKPNFGKRKIEITFNDGRHRPVDGAK